MIYLLLLLLEKGECCVKSQLQEKTAKKFYSLCQDTLSVLW